MGTLTAIGMQASRLIGLIIGVCDRWRILRTNSNSLSVDSDAREFAAAARGKNRCPARRKASKAESLEGRVGFPASPSPVE